MQKVLVFGNSGSGKSTLAKELCAKYGLAHLDLDILAWLPTNPPTRKPLAESQKEIDAFIASHETWVIEGGYADLLELVLSQSNEIIFMNLPVDACQQNSRSRPWEPHKYATKEAQDANLDMLLSWIALYPERDDTFSKNAHNDLYNSYTGKKTMFTSNERNA